MHILHSFLYACREKGFYNSGLLHNTCGVPVVNPLPANHLSILSHGTCINTLLCSEPESMSFQLVLLKGSQESVPGCTFQVCELSAFGIATL